MRDLNHEPTALRATDDLREWVQSNRHFTNVQMKKALPNHSYTALARGIANLCDEGILTKKRDGTRMVYMVVP